MFLGDEKSCFVMDIWNFWEQMSLEKVPLSLIRVCRRPEGLDCQGQMMCISLNNIIGREKLK